MVHTLKYFFLLSTLVVVQPALAEKPDTNMVCRILSGYAAFNETAIIKVNVSSDTPQSLTIESEKSFSVDLSFVTIQRLSESVKYGLTLQFVSTPNENPSVLRAGFNLITIDLFLSKKKKDYYPAELSLRSTGGTVTYKMECRLP